MNAAQARGTRPAACVRDAARSDTSFIVLAVAMTRQQRGRRGSALCAEQWHDGDIHILPQLTCEPHVGRRAHTVERSTLVRPWRRAAAGAVDDAHTTG